MSSTTLQFPEQLLQNVTAGQDQIITEHILGCLGRPSNLFRIDAKHLWDNHYRVNVMCAEETGLSQLSILITDRFHVVVSEDGIRSTPPVERKYR